jgi:hypothetical protein
MNVLGRIGPAMDHKVVVFDHGLSVLIHLQIAYYYERRPLKFYKSSREKFKSMT